MSKEASKKCQMNYRKSVSKDLTFTGWNQFMSGAKRRPSAGFSTLQILTNS